MARIASPKLDISVDSKRNTAECVVTCKVAFSPYELREMREGLWFRLGCELWEDDTLSRDDYLYTYGSKFFPDATPNSPENVRFRATLGLSLLDQEWGRDEVYGKLKLLNFYTRNVVTAKTNVVRRRF